MLLVYVSCVPENIYKVEFKPHRFIVKSKAGTGHRTAYILLTNPGALTRVLKYTAAHEYVYGGAITFPKLAIITLYLRIFRGKIARRCTWLVGIIICLNEIAIIFGASFICRPFAYNWNKTIPGGHCGDIMALYRFVSIPNILTDIAILILPFSTLYKLQVSTSRKLGISLTFLVGGL